jgi:transcriptional regulator with PAS, ATPase and Fis domain
VARALHARSPRRAHPFVALNCGALTETLLESELFGHVKGAFTGANRDHKGLFESANGGTIFLDEIDKAGLPVQRRFLHMLDSGEVRPVGATSYKRLDVRVVCATSCPDLREEVAAGRFLKDLFYRLNDIAVTVPPLRERPDDVVLLAEWFAEKYARKVGRTVAGLSPAFRAALTVHPWPGNVRELEKAMRRAVTLADDGAVLGPELLPATVLESLDPAAAAAAGSLREKVEHYERGLVLDALDRLGWNKSRAAVDLGLSRRGLKGKIERYRLDRRRSRP